MIFVLTEVQEVKQDGRKKHLMAKHFTGPDFIATCSVKLPLETTVGQ